MPDDSIHTFMLALMKASDPPSWSLSSEDILEGLVYMVQIDALFQDGKFSQSGLQTVVAQLQALDPQRVNKRHDKQTQLPFTKISDRQISLYLILKKGIDRYGGAGSLF